MKHKGVLTLIGMILFFTGIIAIVMSMIGVRFSIFSALADYSSRVAFLIYLFLVVLGLLTIIIPNTNLKEDEEIVEP